MSKFFVLDLKYEGVFMSKSQKITLITTICIFTVLSVFLIMWYFGGSYGQFYKISSKEFEIAGLSDGYTPQGITYDEASKTFLTCGYMKDGSASRVYVVKNGQTEKYFTLKLNGEAYVGHAGGIATNGQLAWISGDGKVHCFKFEDIDSVENGKSINIIDSFD